MIPSAGIINGRIGLFGLMVLFSHIDLLTTEKAVDTLGYNGIPLYRLEKGVFGLNARTNYPLYNPQMNRGQEMQYTMEYNYQF